MFFPNLIRWLVLASAFAVPLLFLPFTADALLAKTILAQAIAVVVGTAWLAQALLTRRLSYRRSPLNAAFLLLAVSVVAATISAISPWSSVWGSDPTGEKAATLLAFIILAFVAAAVLRESDVRRVVAVFVGAFGVLGVLAVFSIFPGRLELPAWLPSNPVGTSNTLALVLATGFMVSFGVLLSAVTGSGRRAAPRWLVLLSAAAALVLLVSLLFLGFRAVWIGLAVTLVVAIALNFSRSWGKDGTAFNVASTLAAFIIATLALFAIVKPIPLVGRIFQPPLEVAPTYSGTLAIARRALATDPLFGLGPASFRAAFSRFRDPALNGTPFWQVRFNHGASFAATVPATTGLAGTLAFLAFVAAAIALIGRAFMNAPASNPYLWALGMGATFMLIEWFLYAANFTASFFLFLALGLIAAMTQEPRNAAAPLSWWRVTRRVILIDTPALNFVTSLVAVFAAASSLVILYSFGAFYAAEVSYARAAEAINRYGNVDTARALLERAAVLAPQNDAYHRGQAQVAIVGVGRLIAEAAAAPRQDLAAEFQGELSSGLAAARRAIALNPSADNWSVLGQLYELVVPFVAGAERAAVEAYGEAARRDPVDPLLPLAKGRVLLNAADSASLQASQSRGEERERLDRIYKEKLGLAHDELSAAVRLKPDLAPAQFLLAQSYLRAGNTVEAISRAEQAAALAPSDIGVAFQLGFLYYRSDDLGRAERELVRAVSINPNYSNARYFLGLVYDRRGDRASALAEFQKIAALNPGNTEVERILANIQAGRPALAGIAPPGLSPEARREPPVNEGRRSPALR